jgi:hypothetical protein
VDLNKLLYQHQVALIRMTDRSDHGARTWAGVCADYYAGQIVALRDRLGVPVRTFNHRELSR